MDKQKQIFDEYGNYDFPTDIKQKGLNTVTSCGGNNNHSVEANKTVEDIKCFLVCKKWGEYFIECDESVDCVDCIANGIYNAGYRKIPENAVVLTDDELYEELNTCKVAMIVHDDDGEKYVSLDDYNEYNERLGKISSQRKARIEQLEKLLDDRCDHCIERERKETAEKFADKIQELLNTPFEGKTEKQEYQHKGMEEGLRMALEICKEIMEVKECQNK